MTLWLAIAPAVGSLVASGRTALVRDWGGTEPTNTVIVAIDTRLFRVKRWRDQGKGKHCVAMRRWEARESAKLHHANAMDSGDFFGLCG